MSTGTPTPRDHLFAALLALVIASAGLTAALIWCGKLESRYSHALAPEISDEKLHGVTLHVKPSPTPISSCSMEAS